jgi:hypothetical protein
MKLITSGESLGLFERAWDLCLQNKRKSSRGPREPRLRLDKKERLFPSPNHPGQQHQEKSVRLPVDGSLDLSTEDDVLVS